MYFLDFLPLLIILAGTFFIFKLRFFHIVHPVKTVRLFLYEIKDKSAKRALSLALAGTLGVGNIVGVAYGIQIGGAGCVFWILISSVFASVIKFCECTLSADCRSDGGGGVMYVLQKKFGKIGAKVGGVYALLCLILSFSMGAALQSNAVVGAVLGVCLLPAPLISFILCLLVGVVVLGGGKRISKTTEKIIPIATIVYISLCLGVIILNFQSLGGVIVQILRDALSIKSAGVGISTFIFSACVREGFARGLLSNEAGCGTSSLAQSEATRTAPAGVGLLGMCEVFFDTALLCTLTALSLLLTPNSSLECSGIESVLYCFETAYGTLGALLLVLLVFAFAYSTVICWYYYGISASKYLFKRDKNPIFFLLFIGSLFLGGVSSVNGVILISDVILFMLTLITLSVLIKSSERIKFLTEQYGLIENSDMRKRRRGK